MRNTKPAPVTSPDNCIAEQNEIKRLQQALIEKDAVIRRQQAQQKNQARELRASTRQAVRTQVKLRRMATQTDAASLLAEVEVAMETSKSAQTAKPLLAMLPQAQQLLDSANAAYKSGDYGATVERAEQSREIIDMVYDQRAEAGQSRRRAIVDFQNPIPLRARIESNLRSLPRSTSKRVTILKAHAGLLAIGYRGNWLRVQTEDGHTGWIANTLVEARPDRP